MLDVLTLPAAAAPPTGDLRPPPTASGPATEPAGGQPFEKVLAAAAEAEAEPVDAAPVETDPALLAALAALLNPQPEVPPMLVEAPPPSAEAAGPAPTEAALPAAAAAPLDLVPLTADVAPEALADAPEAGFAAQLAQVAAGADTATISGETAAQATLTGTGAGTPTAPAAKAPAPSAATPQPREEPVVAAETLMAANPAAPAPLNEPARLAEAQPTVRAAATPEAVVLPQVVRGLESLAHSGGSAMHVQLHPEALGRIDLHLTATADGMRVTLTADMAATGNLLQQNLSDLRHSLAESGLNVATLSVNVGQGQADNSYLWQRHLAPNAGGTHLLRADAAPNDVPTRAAAPGMGARVDYRI